MILDLGVGTIVHSMFNCDLLSATGIVEFSTTMEAGMALDRLTGKQIGDRTI